MSNDIFCDLGTLFDQAGHQLFLVGGSVRDKLLGRPVHDLDFTTDASPEEILGLVGPWAESVWDVGREFGTIACAKDGQDIEITTFRTDGPGRKPEVTFTTNLQEDLERRDFTINAMALPVTSQGLGNDVLDIIDPFNGMTDIFLELLDTPRPAVKTMTEDPLRMLRAARFASQLGFGVSEVVEMTARVNNHLIDRVSAERITAEMDKLLMGQDPIKGLQFLLRTGLLQRSLPEVDGIPARFVGTTLEQRWAELLLDVDPHEVGDLVKRLRMSREKGSLITNLVAWVLRFEGLDWANVDDGAVRRLVAAAGEHVPALMELIDDRELGGRVERLLAHEGHPEPFFTGAEVMKILDLRPGPEVGEAMHWLWELRLDRGKLHKSTVKAKLRNWKDGR